MESLTPDSLPGGKEVPIHILIYHTIQEGMAQ